MAQSRKQYERYLSKDEQELCDRARHPTLHNLPHGELIDLAKRLRERRDRARDQVRDRRRVAKGAKTPDGESNVDRKKALLASSLKRVNRELDRRRGDNRRRTATANLRKALKRRRSAQWSGPAYITPDEGMNPTPNEKIAVSGALHAEGQRPVLGRSKKARR